MHTATTMNVRKAVWRLFLVLSALWAISICTAASTDRMATKDPMHPLGERLKEQAQMKTEKCIQFGNPEYTNAFSKYEIDKPGQYCLTEDLHARIEMADHLAEGAIIIIWTSNVVLDLQGHTLGRGRIFKNPGGVGISIRGVTNILIKNGVFQDFDTAISRGTKGPMFSDIDEKPIYDAKTNTYRFPITNIVIENVTFKNNRTNMWSQVQQDMTP